MNLRADFGDNDFKIDTKDGVSILRVNILRVTLKEANALKQNLDLLLSANHHKIIIDFSECSFIDSAIVGIMILAVKGIRKLNGDIIVVVTPGNISNIFAQTGLNKIFKQFDTVEKALTSFSF